MELQKVEQEYTKIASSYDTLTDVLFRLFFVRENRYRRMAVDLLNLRQGDTVLDIGCGTGRNFPFIQRRIGPQGTLIGLDYTPAMLKRATKRCEKNGWTNVELIQGDAAEVDKLVHRQVDGIISSFCLSIVPTYEEVIRKASRLLRSGGRFAVVDIQTLKPRGFFRFLHPLIIYGLKLFPVADLSDYAHQKPWREVMEKELANVAFDEYHWGMGFICCGEKL
jgi:demethylmenaquinone methyltransferase/2-methoxy-6-polyprenyl-1,4-benzoquinol methylase